MEENQKKTDIVDTTDCLEAVSAFKAMKNFLFVVVLICLLLLQGAFVLERCGWIEKGGCVGEEVLCDVAACSCSELPACDDIEETVEEVEEDVESVEMGIEDSGSIVLEPAVENPEPDEADELDAEAETEDIAEAAATVAEGLEPEEQEQAESNNMDIIAVLKPECSHIFGLVRACNFIVVIAAVLYCITLFMSIKISLSGRLGGINHISRAFFLSLFALIILLPWQLVFPAVVKGAIYTPQELLCSGGLITGSSIVSVIFCYLRFTGLWLLVLLLLICSQLRARKWSRATLRRLGILQ